MEVDPLAVIGTGLMGLGLLVEHFHYRAQLQERVVALETEMRSCVGLDKEIRELTTKINLFWGALETHLPDILMGGNPIEKGSETMQLLDTYKKGKLPCDRMVQLVTLLEEESVKSGHSAGDRLAMLLMIASIKSQLGGMVCL